ncbi:MAG: sigma-54-dependent transcriptional regulator [Hyphomicrobiales bacterium]
MNNLNILILDDEKRVRDEIEEFLTSRSFNTFTAGTPSEGLKIVKNNKVDIAILDIKLPEMSGLEVLKHMKSLSPETEVIMISGHGDMNSVIEAMRQGAIDYFPKPFRLVDINNSIERTKRFIKMGKELKMAQQSVDILSNRLFDKLGHKFLGNSPKMKRVMELMAKVAQVEHTSVLIMGESGTGKELVAHGIHYLSKRHRNTFHSVNCSAIPETLFESEFFGHKKGAFTGANEDKPGWFEIANRGTLFLDEIGDMPLVQQAKLLRVLEERKVSKLGSRQQLNVDVRVIAASNQELEKMASEKRFRLDLYHRLSIFVIEIPPLRDRYEDIPVLLDHFISTYNERIGKKITGYSPSVVSHLMTYNFPGNVRELRNMIERAMILCESNQLKVEHFKIPNITFNPSSYTPVNTQYPEMERQAPVYNPQEPQYPSYPPANTPEPNDDNLDLEKMEIDMIKKALIQSDNNKAQAAKLLNITWQSLDRRIKKYNINIEEG